MYESPILPIYLNSYCTAVCHPSCSQVLSSLKVLKIMTLGGMIELCRNTRTTFSVLRS
jgi:hypothetical protein